MRPSLRSLIVGCALAGVIAGCAAKGASQANRAVAPVVAATQPASDPKANLSVDQIEPKLSSLPAPATQPATPAPLEAIQLYAQARSALIGDNQRILAITLL